jgi:hypothetical protein
MGSGMETGRPSSEDARVEAAVLRQLLSLHPVQLTLADLVREIAGEAADFADRDAIARAVRELTAAGLANRGGELVLPSRAALRFYELLE